MGSHPWLREGIDLRPGIIYALRCPKTRRVRYVGKTGKTLAVRFRAHLADAKKNRSRPICNWIRKLIREGMKPIPEVLQECLPGMMNASEQEWIAQYRADGVELLNITDGGEATAWSEEAKRKQSLRCAEKNRELANSPEWIESTQRRHATNKGMTLEQYRQWLEQQDTQYQWNILLNKYNMLLGRVRKQRRGYRQPRQRTIRVDGDVAYMPLTQGQTAIIDAQDVEWVSRYVWSAQYHNGRWRAKRTIKPGDGIELLSWRVARRRLIGNGIHERIELVNHDGLDCRRENIRIDGIGMAWARQNDVRQNANEQYAVKCA
jgi:hypothetical protein